MLKSTRPSRISHLLTYREPSKIPAKVLVLQTLYTLSDDQAEYQMRDRLSFMRFLGLALKDRGRIQRRSGRSASS